MSSVVLVLGAGASQCAGVPLMAEFVDVAQDVWAKGLVEDVDGSFRMFFRGLVELQRMHSKATIDLGNIESILSCLEMARVLGRVGRLDGDDIERLIQAGKQVVVRTIEETSRFHLEGEQLAVNPPHRTLASHIHTMQQRKPAQSVTILTFNYDVTFDLAITRSGFELDYGIGGPVKTPAIQFLKLHGSVNWTQCTQCKAIRFLPIDECARTCSVTRSDLGFSTLRIGEALRKLTCSCGKVTEGVPFIVPPTWDKTKQYDSIGAVWKAAARALSDVQRIAFIGYSFPETDGFFKYLYALGTVDVPNLRRICVIDPSPEPRKRLQAMLGKSVAHRLAENKPDKLEHCVGSLITELFR
jgi:hypothetical protein